MNDSPPTPLPDLSVIVVNLNTRDLLRACLRSVVGSQESGVSSISSVSSLIHAPCPLTPELIVVDNGSTDGSPEMVAAEFPAARLIRNAQNRGFAPANNQGLAVARGRYCVLLNSDTLVAPAALAHLVAFMDVHPEAGACGPQLRNADGSLQPSGRAFPTLASALAELLPAPATWRRGLRGPLDARDYTQTCQVDEVSGAALCLRRAALDQIGLLDEEFFFLGEDVDLCWRLKAAGWQVYYLPEAAVIHLWGGSRKSRDGKISLLAQRGYYLLFRKHRPRIEAGLLKVVVVALTLLKLGKWLLVAARRGDREIARQAWTLHLAELGWLLRH
jgi:GT2 family glycosyltransferase